MNKELELFLKDYIIKEVSDSNEDNWLESLTEVLNCTVVNTKSSDIWYNTDIKVSKIDNKFIQYEWNQVTGTIPITTVCEVKQKTKTMTVTYYE